MFSLINIAFILCFFIGIMNAKSEAEFKKVFMEKGIECSNTHSLTSEEMAMLEGHKMPDGDAAKCFIACVFKKTNWIDDQGMFNVAGATSMVEQEHVDDKSRLESSIKLLDICKKVNDEAITEDPKGCQRALLLYNCLIEHAEKVGFILP